MKRLLSITLAFSMVAISLTACSSSTGNTATGSASSDVNNNGNVVKLSLIDSAYDPGNVGYDAAMAQVDRFNQAYAGQYEVDPVSATDDTYNDKIQQLAMADQLPPVFKTGQNPEWYQDLIVGNNMYYDLSSWLDENPDIKNEVHPESLNFVTQPDGSVSSLPYLITKPSGVVYYNESMFNPSKPISDMSTSEFEQSLGDNKIAMQSADNAWVTSLYFTDLVAQQPGGVEELQNHAVDKETDFTSDIWVNAVTELQNTLQNYATPNSIGDSYADAANEFFSNQAAVILNGSWMIEDLSPSASDKWGENFNINDIHADMMPGNVCVSSLYERGTTVSSHTDDATRQAALTWIQFINSPSELEAIMLAEGGNVYNYTPTDDFFTQLKQSPLAYEIYESMDDSTVYVPDATAVMPTSVSDQEFGKLLPQLADNTLTPEQFCQTLSEKAQQAQQ